MADTTLYLVFSNPVEGREEEYNEWYDNVHVPEVLATPGMVSAQRFELRDMEMASAMGGDTHRYLLVYEMEGDPEVIMSKVRDGVGSGAIVMNDALDLQSVVMSFWSPKGPKITASAS